MPRSQKNFRQTTAAIVVIAGLTAVAIYVTVRLPDRVAQTSPPAMQATPLKAVGQSIPSMTQAVATGESPDQREAAERLGAVSRKLVSLEGEGVRDWAMAAVAGSSISAVDDGLTRAKAAMASRRFRDAIGALLDVERMLDILAQTKQTRFSDAIDAGEGALGRLDAGAANAQFKIALAIQPADQRAGEGMTRARSMPEVLALVVAGDTAFSASDFSAARDAYMRALQIDPKIHSLREKLRAAEGESASRDYQDAMTTAYARLKADDPKSAEIAAHRAQRLRPAAPEVVELRRQIAAAARNIELSRLQKQGERAESEENWRDAVAAYVRVLAIDPSAAFAARGKARADRQVEIHSAIDAYLAEPSRLESTDPRNHARSIVQLVSEGDSGPILKSKAQRLGVLLQAALAPVSVTIRSDGATEIEILRSGSLGSFLSREVALSTGRYTAVGRRAGYRDVRVQFELLSGKQTEPIVVQCTEQVRQ